MTGRAVFVHGGARGHGTGTRHHKHAHQPGWHLKLLPDGELHITTPDGTTRTTRPPGPHTPNLWDQD